MEHIALSYGPYWQGPWGTFSSSVVDYDGAAQFRCEGQRRLNSVLGRMCMGPGNVYGEIAGCADHTLNDVQPAAASYPYRVAMLPKFGQTNIISAYHTLR